MVLGDCEYNDYFLCVGGIKWSGRMFGSSLPSIFTVIKCIAKANSSISKKPSQSTSESFQIFDNTELGSFDLISSDLAAKTKEIWVIKRLQIEELVLLFYLRRWFFHQLDLKLRTLDRCGDDRGRISIQPHQNQRQCLLPFCIQTATHDPRCLRKRHLMKRTQDAHCQLAFVQKFAI